MIDRAVLASAPECVAAIGLGSNLGNSPAVLQAAWRELHIPPAIVPLALSSPYRTQPVDMDSAHWFVNAAALVQTRMTPHALLHLLHSIEARHGRVRDTDAHGHRDRTLDLDLLLYGDLVIDDQHLNLPHPRLEQRLFVLAPLAEIAVDFVHPRSGKTIGTLMNDVKKISVNQIVERIAWEANPPRLND